MHRVIPIAALWGLATVVSACAEPRGPGDAATDPFDCVDPESGATVQCRAGLDACLYDWEAGPACFEVPAACDVASWPDVDTDCLADAACGDRPAQTDHDRQWDYPDVACYPDTFIECGSGYDAGMPTYTAICDETEACVTWEVYDEIGDGGCEQLPVECARQPLCACFGDALCADPPDGLGDSAMTCRDSTGDDRRFTCSPM
jgi:hypothetical protein